MNATREWLWLVVGLVLGVTAAAATRPAPPPPLPLPQASGPKGLAPTLAVEERVRPAAAKLAALESELRNRLLPPDAVVRLLDVRPGSRALDIGAGSGRISVPLARAVAPDGHVDATDIDPRMFALLRQRTRELGLGTLHPHLVHEERDPFYRGRQWDRVLLCTVYEYLGAPGPFVASLRERIAAGGRLVVLQGKVAPGFLPTDFGSGFDRHALRTNPLWAPLRRLVPAEGDDEAMAAAFDRAIASPTLLGALLDGYGPGPDGLAAWLARLAPSDRAVAGWLLDVHGREPGLWRGHGDPHLQRVRRLLSWYALTPLFREDLIREFYPRGVYFTPEGLRRRFEAAGWRALPTAQPFAAHDVLIFEPSGS
ncbi:MAG: hypothetical protein RIT45_2473 [Pseudomonadota bacterium]|jgi:SAM-dependent methyltransferase